MERLTIPDEKIEGGWRRAVIDSREVKKYAMPLYWALKKYEDTGLTPLEILELKERDTAKAPQKVDEQPYFRKHFDSYSCPVCHKKVESSWKFCGHCGQKLKED